MYADEVPLGIASQPPSQGKYCGMSLGDEFAARLTQLAELHADGALTDEELIAAKARLLKSGGKVQGLKKQPYHPRFNSGITSPNLALTGKLAYW